MRPEEQSWCSRSVSSGPRSCGRLRSRYRWCSRLLRYRSGSYRRYGHYPQISLCGIRSCSRITRRSNGRRSQQESPHERRYLHGWTWLGCPVHYRWFPSICFRCGRQTRYTVCSLRTGHCHIIHDSHRPELQCGLPECERRSEPSLSSHCKDFPEPRS